MMWILPIIKQALDPEEDNQSLIANWGGKFKKILSATFKDDGSKGIVQGVILQAKAKSLGLIHDPQDDRLPYGGTRGSGWKLSVIPAVVTQTYIQLTGR
jgi:hypothetical protein